MSRRAIWIVIVAAVILGFAAGTFGAAKSYQFTGTVKTVQGNTFTVEKNAKETWSFSTDASTKGTPKVGERVTVFYKMIATEIESKGAATTEPGRTKGKKK